MNKSTIFTAFAFVGCSLQSYGQQTTKDIGMNAIINLYNGIVVYPNIPTFPQYTITNFGSTSVSNTDADSVYREFDVNSVRRTKANVTLGTIGAGQTSGTFTAVNSLDWGTYSLTAGSVSVCGRTRFWKNGLLDANPSNDETCIVVTYNSTNYTYDAAINNLVMSLPSYPAGAHLPIPTFPSEMTFDLENKGTNDLIQGLPLTLDFSVDGGTVIPLVGTLTTPVSSPGSTALMLNWPAGASLPLTAKQFDICLAVNSADDINSANDEYCVTYNMGNPAAIVELDDMVYGEVFYSNRMLKINFNEYAKGSSLVELYDINGKKTAQYELNLDENKNQQIELTDLNTGVYISNITVNGTLMTYKFMVN